MANWKQYSNPYSDSVGFVDVDKIVQIIVMHDYDIRTYEKLEKKWTRLFTGHVAMAANEMGSSSEYFYVDAKEPPEYFIGQPTTDSVTP